MLLCRAWASCCCDGKGCRGARAPKSNLQLFRKQTELRQVQLAPPLLLLWIVEQRLGLCALLQC